MIPQLKILLWRNVVIKKRGYLTTLLEFLIPIIIIIVISKYNNFNIIILILLL